MAHRWMRGVGSISEVYDILVREGYAVESGRYTPLRNVITPTIFYQVLCPLASVTDSNITVEQMMPLHRRIEEGDPLTMTDLVGLIH